MRELHHPADRAGILPGKHSLNSYRALAEKMSRPEKPRPAALPPGENGLPFLGTCGGFQHAVLEYALVLGVTMSSLLAAALLANWMPAREAMRVAPQSAMALE